MEQRKTIYLAEKAMYEGITKGRKYSPGRNIAT
jgi:hypothetical protein